MFVFVYCRMTVGTKAALLPVPVVEVPKEGRVFFRIGSDPGLVRLGDGGVVFFFQPIFVAVYLAKIVVQRAIVVRACFDVVTSVAFNVCRLRDGYTVFFRGGCLGEGGEVVTVVGFVSLGVNGGGVSLDQLFFPFLQREDGEDDGRSVPILETRASFGGFRYFLVTRLRGGDFVQDVFPSRELYGDERKSR